MNQLKKHIKRLVPILMLILVVTVLPAAAAAEETGPAWRGTYDEIMLWVNFAILAFLIFKYGRTPIKDFLEGQKYTIEKEIMGFEKKRDSVAEDVRLAEKALEEGEARFARIKERIINQGERKKAATIEDAMQQSRMMIEAAERKADSKIVNAIRNFRIELIDEAMDKATQRLTKEVTPDDDAQLLTSYMKDTLV